MSSLRIVCLSLERRRDRQFVFQWAWPGLRDLPVEFFPAVDGELVAPWRVAEWQARWGLPEATPANWAVRLSKRLILREFLQSCEDFLLFVEDDCSFLPGFAQDVEALLAEPEWDVAFLGTQLSAAAQGGVQRMPPSPDNHCVLFSREGARRALRLLAHPRNAFSDQDLQRGIEEGILRAAWTGRNTAAQRASLSNNFGDRTPLCMATTVGMMAGPDDGWLLAAAVQPGDTVVEWGCGGSTVILAIHVGPEGHVYSFEHQEEYAVRTRSRLQAWEMESRVTLQCIPPMPHRGPINGWRTLPGQMNDYVEMPGRLLPHGSVNVVFIDGRERMRCVEVALTLLRPGGLLLIHDFWGRARYREHIGEILKRAQHVCSTPMSEKKGLTTDLAMFRKRGD
jgi:predicted O-methyltransferase YrrM